MRKAEIKIIVILCIGLSANAQLSLTWKRMADVTLYFNDDSDKIENQLFDAHNFYLEKTLKNKAFSLGLDLAYSEYHPNLNSSYDYLGGNQEFYDRSFSVGVSGRWYCKAPWSGRIDNPNVKFNFYAELSLYGNHLHINQPIVIEHDFGTYERIIDEVHYFISGSFASGFSWGGSRWRWEPYMQFGLMPTINDKRANLVAVSSIGMAHSYFSFFITPLALKVILFK